MFCNKCGNQVNDNEKFCPSCGADMTDAAQTGAPAPKESNSFANLNFSVGTDAKSISFYIAAGCYLLMAIFMFFCDWYTLSVSAFGASQKRGYNLLVFGSLGKDLNTGTVLWILVSIVLLLLVLAFIGCGVMYVLKRLKGDQDYQKFGLLGMAIAVVIFIIALLTAIIGSIAIKGALNKAAMGYMNVGSMVKFYAGFWSYATLVLALAGGVCVKKS